MSASVSEYEAEILPELGLAHESEFEGEVESEQFFGALASLARRGAGWLTAAGSPQRRLALALARQTLNQGLPALRRALGPNAVDALGSLLPQHEYEAELDGEFEISPIRRIYPDAMLEHLGHAATAAQGEAEAEALAAAMIPLAAQLVPQAAPALMRASPGLVSGISGIVQRLRRDPTTQPLVRVVPAIVRRTAAGIAQQTAGGASITPEAALRMLARQTLRMLGNPQQSARAFRRSRALDGLFHRRYHVHRGGHCTCPTCAVGRGAFDFEAAPAPAACRAMTAAEARIVARARSEAIKLANQAANKLDAAVKPGPRSSEAQETARLFKFFFCHDPRLKVPWADNMASGTSVALRLRAVARELGGGRRITFRTCPDCPAGTDADTCCAGERAFTLPTLPDVITLCRDFWTPPPGLRGLPPEVFRGSTILHEMLHVLYPGWFGHGSRNTSIGGERRRNNAHCYKAFALRVMGYGADLDVVPGCTSRLC